MATVILPRMLVDLFPGSERKVDVEGGTVVELITGLNERWPGMWDRLCESPRSLRRHINVFVDGERSTLETEVGSHSEVHIIPAISGG